MFNFNGISHILPVDTKGAKWYGKYTLCGAVPESLARTPFVTPSEAKRAVENAGGTMCDNPRCACSKYLMAVGTP